jgi:hypothetical protein
VVPEAMIEHEHEHEAEAQKMMFFKPSMESNGQP